DDTGSASPNVNLSGSLVPASVTVTNDANDYTFSGTGSITTDVLTKNLSKNLTFANSGNNALGTVTVNGGALTFVNAGATTVNSLTTAGGTTLTIGNGTTAGAGNLSGP